MKSKKFSKKAIITIIIILILAIAATIIYFKLKPKEEEMNFPQQFTTLEKTDVIEEVQTSGRIESEDSAAISAKTDGKIAKVFVKLGDKVGKGQTLAQIDTTSIKNEIDDTVKTHDLEVETARKEMEAQKDEYDNSKFMYDLGEISKQDLSKAKKAYFDAKDNYKKKNTSIDLSKLKNQLADATIKSPISGTVTMINAVEGTNSSGVLFVVEDTNNLKIVVKVSEYDVNKIKPGQKVTVKTEMTEDTELKGKVTTVSPAAIKDTSGKIVTEGKVQFEVEVHIIDKNSNVKVGSNARANIVLGGKKNIYAVTFDSLVDNGDGTGSIYVPEKKGDKYIVKDIPVKTGIQNDFMIEIKGEELKEGMQVLNNALDLQVGQEIILE